METTKITTASVNIMLSYDYSHFEMSMSLSNDDGLNLQEIDLARKNCQRLADKAVKQHQIMKEKSSNILNSKYQKEEFEKECHFIQGINEKDRTLKQKSMLKAYTDHQWETQFDKPYDYEDSDYERYS